MLTFIWTVVFLTMAFVATHFYLVMTMDDE